MITVDMSDEALGVGMPCGGTMDIFIEPVLPRPELLDRGPRPHCRDPGSVGRPDGLL